MRIDYRRTFPAALRAMLSLEKAVEQSDLEAGLLDLVKMRASQLNGCGYCLDMHSKDARARGESEQRLNVLAAWREAPFYSERERAALAWCEALTLLPQAGAPDEVYEQLRAQFDEQEIVALTLAIVAINGWNRFAVGLRTPVGSYVSPLAAKAESAVAPKQAHEGSERERGRTGSLTDVGPLTTLKSPYSVSETADRLLAALQRHGFTVFARIDHSGAARGAGLELADEQVVIFGDPRMGTQLMQADPTVGHELPLRMLIWDADGQTMLGYRPGGGLASGHALAGQTDIVRRISTRQAQLAAEVVSTDAERVA